MSEPVSIGDWKRVEELGSGSFGIVSLWANKSNGDYLAIKKCKWNSETYLTPRQKERWISEVKIMQTINNKNIVAYCKLPKDLENGLQGYNPSKLPILSMEYCSLGNLRSVLSKVENCCGLSEIEVIEILKDISNALSYLHKLKITHRDVKPENIVLQMSNTNKSAICYKLIDLGYAKELNSSTISFVGTLQYLAPEIFSQQIYNETVDYWSLGITAFEIICGIRPFLYINNGIQSYEYIKAKDSNVICIQYTYNGEIKSSNNIPVENYLNICLKEDMEKWLRSVLEFDPHKRGLIENNNIKTFQYLQHILSKTIITVFSVYNYKFYSYEVNESTLMTTLQDWVAKDQNISKNNLYLIPTNSCDSIYAKDYYDENNPNAMIFVFRRGSSMNEQIQVTFPNLIVTMFQNMKTEFKFDTLRLLHAQIVYFITNEAKHSNCLRHSITYTTEVLNNLVDQEIQLGRDIKASLQIVLSEIEFYNMIENSSLYFRITENTNCYYVLNDNLLEYRNYMVQLQELVNTINLLLKRYHHIFIKNNNLQLGKSIVVSKLENYNFNSLIFQAQDYYSKYLKNTKWALIGEPYILKIISATMKIRDKLLTDRLVLHFLRGLTGCLSELNKLKTCREAVKIHLSALKNQLRNVVIERLQLVQNLQSNNVDNKAELNENFDLINTNTSLTYKLQQFTHKVLIQHKEILMDDDISIFSLHNGEK